jgi:hypothetical protein
MSTREVKCSWGYWLKDRMQSLKWDIEDKIMPLIDRIFPPKCDVCKKENATKEVYFLGRNRIDMGWCYMCNKCFKKKRKIRKDFGWCNI